MTVSHPLSGARAGTPAPAATRAVGIWLLVCCAMIFAMVVIGGVTRLTESGLSIVRWDPIGGAIPPLDQADWQRLFEAYQTSPQYLKVNHSMDLATFKTIFWWEYVHRLWGRLIGVVFLVPFVWFLATGRIVRTLRVPLAGLFVLGGLQGALGWWMVTSGLRDVPWVSPYRLTAHLGLALMIYGAALWLALSLLRAPAPPVAARLRRGAWAVVALVSVTVAAGGFVAGTDAGLIYNTFPLMGDGLVPPDYRNPALSWLANTFENHAAVQFHHRVLAIGTVIAVGAYWAMARGRTRFCAWVDSLFALVLVQAGLGIATLLLQVPVALAAAHQAGAVALLTVALAIAHGLTRTRETT